VATAVNSEFTLQTKTPPYSVWQCQQRRAPDIQQVFVWQMMWYGFYDQGLTRQTIFEKGVLDCWKATNKKFQELDRLFENFMLIKYKLCIC
jgi:hypothetical protein